MDVLSEVLKAVRLEGALFFNAEFSAPWCLSSTRSADIAHYLSPRAGHLIIYHLLIEGHAYAKLPGGRREELTAGDIVVLPHGDAHFLGNGSPAKPVDSFRTFAKNLSQGLKLARFGGGGEITRFVCGYMACDPRLSEIFLAGLPKILKVHVANEPSGQKRHLTAHSSGNLIVPLRNSVALVRPHWLNSVVRTAERHDRCGATKKAQYVAAATQAGRKVKDSFVQV